MQNSYYNYAQELMKFDYGNEISLYMEGVRWGFIDSQIRYLTNFHETCTVFYINGIMNQVKGI